MIKILASRGTGKTAQLLKEAQADNAVVVCSNPNGLEYKAKALGINDLKFMSYGEFYIHHNQDHQYMVDEIDGLLQCMNVIGYNMSIDD